MKEEGFPQVGWALGSNWRVGVKLGIKLKRWNEIYDLIEELLSDMSQPDPTCQILSVLGLIVLTDLFLVTTHGPKTHLTRQQSALLIRPTFKSSPVDVRYYNSPPLRSSMTSSAQLESQWDQLWYQMSQSDPTCQILFILGLTALTDLFLVTTHGLKTRLTSH